MALTTMYEGKNNSPQTDITSAITASDTVIPVTDITVFPAAPNLATIGTDENAEVIRYNGIDGSTLTGCERGFGGTTATAWAADSVISRQITKYDLDTLRGNILDLENRKLETIDTTPTASSTNPVTSGGIKTALDLKAPLESPALTGTPTAPTAAAGTNTTQIATTSYVKKYAPLHVSGTASAGSTYTISNANITATMRVINCVFGTPSNVTSDVTWTTAAGTVTFTGTFAGSTTIDADLVEFA